MMGSVIPQINGIEPEEVLDRYVWLDEDDNQVSPVHREFRSAIIFISDWQKRWDRLVARYGLPAGPDDQRFQKSYVPMTRSGKPPTQLKRLHINIELVEPTDEELAIARSLIPRKEDDE